MTPRRVTRRTTRTGDAAAVRVGQPDREPAARPQRPARSGHPTRKPPEPDPARQAALDLLAAVRGNVAPTPT